MNALRRLAALLLGTVFVIKLSTAHGQAPARAPATTTLPAARSRGHSTAWSPPTRPRASSRRRCLPTQRRPRTRRRRRRSQETRAAPKNPPAHVDRRPTAILKAWSTPREEAIKNGLNPSPLAAGACAWTDQQDDATGGQRCRRDDDDPKCCAGSGRHGHYSAGRGCRERSAGSI